MDQQEILNTIALTRLNYFTLAGLLHLYRTLGSATAVLENRNHIRDVLPDASDKLVTALRDTGEAMRRAEVELEFDLKHDITPLTLIDEAYPERLRDVDDAPLVLFYRGNADLNQQRVINIVGTRHCTAYGQDAIMRFLGDLRQICPQVLIVSGLAYGVDINAHRQALARGYETVGVLAHGLDDLYPRRHRETAVRMVSQGGLLTEFMTQTNADKMNFVRRNRIVAGMSDACVLVESAAKGGGLITAEISQGYGRDVFAFPGRIGDVYSEGCNRLIQNNGAGLLLGAEDFVKAMGWESDGQLDVVRQQGIEREMFPELSSEEQRVVKVLRAHNDLQVNLLSVQADIPIGKLTSVLFSLELKGVIKPLAGGMYHLLM